MTIDLKGNLSGHGYSGGDGSSFELDHVLETETRIQVGLKLVHKIPIAIDDLLTVEMTKKQMKNLLPDAADDRSSQTKYPLCFPMRRRNASDSRTPFPLRRASISRWHPLAPSFRIDRALSAHLVRRYLLRLRRFHAIPRIYHALHQERPANCQYRQHQPPSRLHEIQTPTLTKSNHQRNEHRARAP